jgi:Tol biopolymer transport system component/DNA-binding winged helix-turn-helix (wHTH) protein
MTSSTPHRVRFGPFEADLDTHELWKNGLRVKLGGQPFEILALLLRKPGQMVSREELQKELWAEDTFVDFNHGLNAAVNKLRETLADSAEEPKYVETLPRRGYRFVGTVESPSVGRLDVGAVSATAVQQPQLAESRIAVAAMNAPAEEQARPVVAPVSEIAPKRRPRWRIVAAALGMVAVAATVFGVVLSKWPQYRERITKEVMEEAEGKLRNAEASHVSTLVPDPSSDPAISPDGKLVAFRRNSYTPGGAGIFVTSSEGNGVLQLTDHPGDCCPAWSPDGKMLAFTRIAADEYAIYVVNAKGGTPRKISHEDPRKKRGELAWTPDGKSVAFSGDSASGGAQIFLVSASDSSLRPLSEPQGQDRDWGPSFSPDGAQMAFVRTSGAGFPEEVYIMPANGGAARLLTYDRSAIMGPPAWSPDGQYVIFSSTREGDPTLWQIPAAGGTATRMENTSTGIWHPTVARQGEKMAAQKIVGSSGIYCATQVEGIDKWGQSIITSTNGRNEGASFSPDGKRIAFMSDRSGSLEIWVSNRDGSAATQLTSMHGSGTPRWSPDGLWIVFDTTGNGPHSLWVISAFGGTPRMLAKDQFDNVVGSWSRDGKWIYFSSNRTGRDEVWKIPAAGGRAAQVTAQGGFAALESPDGATLYYAKTRYDNTELWKVPAAGGSEMRLAGVSQVRSWAAWGVSSRGIFYCPLEGPNVVASIDFYDFETRLGRQIALLNRIPFWLSASADGKAVLFNQAEQDESSIVLVKAK